MKPRYGLVFVVAWGLVHALFSAWLAKDGHQPSRTVFGPNHYWVQAGLVLPAYLLVWWLVVQLSMRVQNVTFEARAGALALALAGPGLITLLIPELIAYACYGFSILPRIVPYTASLTLLITIVGLIWANSGPRRWLLVPATLLLQSLLLGPWLR